MHDKINDVMTAKLESPSFGLRASCNKPEVGLIRDLQLHQKIEMELIASPVKVDGLTPQSYRTHADLIRNACSNVHL
jgi:hypothetical protein